jgi:hypothetical protein
MAAVSLALAMFALNSAGQSEVYGVYGVYRIPEGRHFAVSLKTRQITGQEHHGAFTIRQLEALLKDGFGEPFSTWSDKASCGFLRNEDGFMFVLPRVRDRHVLIRGHDYVRKAGSKADEAVVHEYAAGRLFRTSYFKEGRGLRRFTIWDGQKEREDGALVSGPGLLSDCSL